MIGWTNNSPLTDPDINSDADHLADALGYVFYSYMHPELHSYACECKRCNLTHYTSYKRSNCEYCGCDTDQFTCRELK